MSKIVITNQLMAALFQGFQALFKNGFEQAPNFYGSLVTQVPSSTSEEVYGWLGQTTGFREWLGDRVIQALKTDGFKIINKHFENTVGVSRNQIEDDRTGILAPVFTQLGMDAKAHPDQVVFELLELGRTALCYDGKPFFAADHPVLVSKDKSKTTPVSNLTVEAGNKPMWYVFDTSKAIKPLIWQSRKAYEFVRQDRSTDDIVFQQNMAQYGVDGRCNAGFGLWQQAHACNKDLTGANFKAIRAAMRGIKGDNGRPLTIKPVEIHVPTDLESAAEQVFEKALISAGETNELYKAVKVVVNPYLANAS